MDAPMPNADTAGLPKLPVRVTPPKLPRGVDALAAEVAQDVAAGPPEGNAAGTSEASLGVTEAAPVPGLMPTWGWVLLILVAAGVLGGGFWWWRSKRPKAPKVPPPDLLEDWKAFRRALPRNMRRVIGDLQPVVVLGSNASEKEQIARQQSEMDQDDPRLFYQGGGLGFYFGATSLVVVPTDKFLDGPSPLEDEGWRKVLKRLSSVRAPRVVVCFSQALLDAGDLDQITVSAARLRGHLDLIATIRDEDIELSVALAQTRGVEQQRSSCATDALFELLYFLGQQDADQDGVQETLSIPLSGLSALLPSGAEERREHAKNWVAQQLRVYQQGWPRLLAHPRQDAASMLAIGRFFEEFQVWSASLGAGLAELLVQKQLKDPEKDRSALGQELCLLPCRQAGVKGTTLKHHLIGRLSAFAGPEEAATRTWRPKQSLLHRLVVASAVLVVSLSIWMAYSLDKSAWDEAATAALRYEPSEGGSELGVVLRYVGAGVSRPGIILPEFFGRGPLKCIVVSALRSHLKELIDHAVKAFEPPEDVLPLVALYVTGNPEQCSLEEDPSYLAYHGLARVIEDNIEDWRHASGLTENEITGYLELACPQLDFQLEDMEAEYGEGRMNEQPWASIPNVAAFGSDLQKLRGQCQLNADEKIAIRHAETVADALGEVGKRRGATLSVLETMHKLTTPGMKSLTAVFEPYAPRLQSIEDLGDEQDDMQLLARDLRPFNDLHGAGRRAPEMGSLGAFNERLRAHVLGVLPAGEDAVVRLTVASNTYVIDRSKVRASLMVRALGQLQQSFFTTIVEQELATETQELIFFSPERYDRPHVWTTPRSIPTGLFLANEVPWRYTAAGFHEAVLGPLEEMRQLLAAQTCGDTSKGSERLEYVQNTSEFVMARLSTYLVQYADSWRAVYDSFGVFVRTDAELSAALTALSQPTSVHLALLREVLAETQLSAAENSPFAELLGAAKQPFETLAAAVNEKAFAEYQALLAELSNAGQAEAGARALPTDAAAAPGPPNAKATLDAFVAELSGFGRVFADGLRDPEEDVRARAQAWATDVGLAPALAGPLLLPIEEAYTRGEKAVARELDRWWRAQSKALDTDVLNRFPFSRRSTVDASFEAMLAWLDPALGRFANEILPIYQLVTRCGARPCVELPEGLQTTVERMREIQHTLFDAKGEPQPLSFQVEPIPFDSQAFLPKRSSVKLGDRRYEYFNTVPRALEWSVPWQEAYVASLNVELVTGGTVDELASPISTRKSIWGLLRLLQAAATAEDGRYRWDLQATLHGARRGKVSVSYQVCQDESHCGGLLKRVLGW
jgi:hypothetical protein